MILKLLTWRPQVLDVVAIQQIVHCSFLCTWAIAGIFQPFPGVSISRRVSCFCSSIIVWVHHVFCGSGITNQEFARTDNKAIQSSEISGQRSDRLILAGRWFVPKSFPCKLHQFQAPKFSPRVPRLTVVHSYHHCRRRVVEGVASMGFHQEEKLGSPES